MSHLLQHIEALIFAAEHPVSLAEIEETLEETFLMPAKTLGVEDLMKTLLQKYQNPDFAFQIVEISGGYQFMTKPEFHDTIGTLLKQKNTKRLSTAALETLAIIAYKQPISKVDVELIRGVNSDYSVQKLLEKELISIVGRSDKPGRPLLYGTSPKFMDYFGIKSLSELPKLKDFKEEGSEIGNQAPIELEVNNQNEK